jgi:hypothetical protein
MTEEGFYQIDLKHHKRRLGVGKYGWGSEGVLELDIP